MDLQLAVRWLAERDLARNSGDKMARAVLAHLQGEAVDFGAVLLEYHNEGGSALALPVEGKWIVNCYDWTNHVTKIVSLHDDETTAQRELARLKAREQVRRDEARAREAKIPRPLFYSVVKAGSKDPTKRGFAE